MKKLKQINAPQVGASDQLGNGSNFAGQTDELSSSKQENRTFLSDKVKVLTRGFVSEQSIAVSLNRHLRGATKKIFLSKKIADMKNIKRLLLSEEETTVKEVNLLNQANASQIGATEQLDNGKSVVDQTIETSCSVEEENYAQIQTADGLVVQQTTDEV